LQKRELRNELTLQETIISEMEDELKLTKSAKYAAEQACKSLQQKVNDVDSVLRLCVYHVILITSNK
jgi:hypothetical protein